MDSAACVTLAVVEALLFSKFHGTTESISVARVIYLALAHFLAVKYYRIFLYHRFFSPLRHIPGPKDNHFFFGQALNLVKADSPTELYVKWMRQFPDAPVVRYRTVANTEVLVCNSINSHQDVLQTHCYAFKKTDLWRRMTKQITGHGIITMEFGEHRANRRMLTPFFTLNNLRKLESVFQQKANNVSRLLERAIAAGPDGRTGVIKCVETFSKATLDVMGVTTLGKELSLLASENDETTEYSFHKAYEVIFGPGTVGKLLLFGNGFFPVRWIPIAANRDFLYATDWLHEVLRQLSRDRYAQISQAIKSGKYKKGEPEDLLTLIVEESIPGGAAEGISEEAVVGHLLQFMAAGHETSANALAWSVFVMVDKLEIQKKLRAEIDEMAQKSPNPTFAEIDALPYLDNFIREVLRLYAPATTTHRQAEHDVVVDGVLIPKGTTIDVIPHVTLLNPHIWGDDVNDFDPDRWDSLPPDAQNPYSFNVFSNGTRICMGRAFSYQEIKIFLVEVIRNYRFLDVVTPYVLDNPSFTLHPGGLEVRLERVDGK